MSCRHTILAFFEFLQYLAKCPLPKQIKQALFTLQWANLCSAFVRALNFKHSSRGCGLLHIEQFEFISPPLFWPGMGFLNGTPRGSGP
jgi:hypothetical protein